MKKNVIVFGASGDLGLEISNYFVEKKYNLVLTYNRNKPNLAGSSKSKNLYCFKCNLEMEQSIENLIKKAIKKIDFPDLIINASGIFEYDQIKKFNYKDAIKIYKVNALSTIIINKVIYSLKKKKLTKIITIGSSSALDGYKDTYTYCGSKHALLGIIKSLNKSFYHKKIVNFCINPGSLKNSMGKKIRSKDYNNFIQQKEIIKTIDYLNSVDLPGLPEEIYIKRFI